MTTRATADNKYIRKYIYLSLAGLGFFLWGVYDAIYKFPKQLQMAEAFDPIREDPDAVVEWGRMYERNKELGWDREPPHNSAETVRGYIRFNNFIIIGGIGLMSYFLLKYVRTKGSWMEANETGINTSWGQSLDFDKITKINKRRWKAKGIAKVAYKDARGRSRTMVFDDFKYDQEPMSELMTMCEQGLTRDQIVGGKSQAEIAAGKIEHMDNESEEDLESQVSET